MARLDVCRLKLKGRVRYVLELQSDHMREIPTVLVAPIVSTKHLKSYSVINPVLEIDGEHMAARLEQMAGVPASSLGEVVLSLAGREGEISLALNKLIFYV